MDQVSQKLQVLFEEPFWIGLFERHTEGKLSVCKVTFGSEPKDYEIYEFIQRTYFHLRFSPAVACDVKEVPKNPKKIQRDIQKSLQNTGIGTKSQQALKLQHEQCKLERTQRTALQKEAEKEHQFELHQRKKKEKHRGR